MNQVKIFSRSPFSLLWWSGTLSSFGDWGTLFASVALASYLGKKSGNSELTAIIPVIARVIPAFLSSFAGVFADRFNKKAILVFCDLSRMLIVFSLIYVNSLTILFLVNFLSEIFSLVRQPAREAALPEIVNSQHLVKANSLSALGTYVTLPLASLFFGLVVDFDLLGNFLLNSNGWPGTAVFFVDTITFALSAYLVSFIPLSKVKVLREEGEDNLFGDYKEGFVYFVNNKKLKIVVFSICSSLFGAGSLFVLGHPYLTQFIGYTESAFGFVITSFGVGVLFSMLILNSFLQEVKGASFLIGLSLLIAGLSLYIAINSAGFTFFLISIFIAGLGTGSGYIITLSYLQFSTPASMRGRVFGNFYSLGRLALLLAFFSSGVLATFINNIAPGKGTVYVLEFSAILILITGILAMAIGRRELLKEFSINNFEIKSLGSLLISVEDEPE